MTQPEGPANRILEERVIAKLETRNWQVVKDRHIALDVATRFLERTRLDHRTNVIKESAFRAQDIDRKEAATGCVDWLEAGHL